MKSSVSGIGIRLVPFIMCAPQHIPIRIRILLSLDGDSFPLT